MIFLTCTISAQYSLTIATYSQGFNGLGTATSAGVTGGDLNIVSGTLNGWYFSEALANQNTTITTGTGSSATGDTYNFGAAAGADRTLGGLRSGTLNPTIGFYFTNNTGSTINSLAITYNGETWRVGAATRIDKIDFQYSTDATSLITGTWTDFDLLDYANPGQATGSGSVQHTASVSNTITGLNIANGTTFFIRWTDADASGADDGMGVDDFSFTATFAPPNTITTGLVSSPPFVLANCAATATGTVDFTSTDIYTAGNVFTAQLSDDIGSFTAPISIGTLTLSGAGPSGTINITIPAGTAGGTGYRIRVVSDNPVVLGSQSAAFTVTQNGLGGCSSSHSDFYRSFQNGDWDDILTWESSSDNVNWVAATLAPTALANTITVQGPHTVMIVANGNADQLRIAGGATLDHNGGTFTLQDGGGDDIDILSGGTLLLSSPSTSPTCTGSSTINVNTGGRVMVSNSGLTGAGTGVNASNYVYLHQSILEYTPTSPFSSGGVTFFPNNLSAVVIPIFRTSNAGSITVGAAAATAINGVFECNGGGVTWTSAGTKTFRNGIRGTGPVSATATSGTFIINGTTADIGGSGSLTVPTTGLQVGASTMASITSNKTITGDVTLLADSYLDLLGNNLAVTGVINGGAANAYVMTSSSSGVLRLNTVISKTFPVGNSSYNPVVVSNGQNSDFYVKVEDGINPVIAFPTYGINRTWSIYASVVTPNVGIVFQYAGADANAGATQPQDMEILQYSGAAWNIISGQTNITPAGVDPYTITANGTGLSIAGSIMQYALGIDGGWILPLDCIISCRSRKINNSGIISWDINSCAEVNSFEVQRSVNGGAYQTIGTVTPGATLDYSYTDHALVKGTNLYRVKVNRSSGAVKYSNTVAIINDTKGILITALSPNPVNSKATLVINAARPGAVNFAIQDMMGRLVKQWQENITEGSNTITINAATLPAGIYHLAAANEDSKTVMRFVKQ